jgi:hypothetical protein
MSDDDMQEVRDFLLIVPRSGGRDLLRNQFKKFDSIILSSDDYPEECFQLVLDIIQSEVFSKIVGIDMFMQSTFSDVDRLNHDQKERLLKAIDHGYKNFDDEDACWLLCDFLARQYDEKTALAAFRSMSQGASRFQKNGVALGLDIIIRKSIAPKLALKASEEILRSDG